MEKPATSKTNKMTKKEHIVFLPDSPQPQDSNPPVDDEKGILAVGGDSGLWYYGQDVDDNHQIMISSSKELAPNNYTVYVLIEGQRGRKQNVRIEKGKTTSLFVTLGKSIIPEKPHVRNNPTFAVSPPTVASPFPPPGYGYLKVNNVGGAGGYCTLDGVNWRGIPTIIPLTQSTGYTVYVSSSSGLSSGSRPAVAVTVGKTTTVSVTFSPP